MFRTSILSRFIILLGVGFTAACGSFTVSPPTATLTASPSPTFAYTPSPTPPTLPQDWNSTTSLIVINPEGVWLRVNPSFMSWEEGMLFVGQGESVRVIGDAVYERGVDFGQWWWLVSAESRRFGWVEETSLGVVDNLTPDPTIVPSR